MKAQLCLDIKPTNEEELKIEQQYESQEVPRIIETKPEELNSARFTDFDAQLIAPIDTIQTTKETKRASFGFLIRLLPLLKEFENDKAVYYSLFQPQTKHQKH